MDKQAVAVLPAQQALEQLHTSLEGLNQSEAERRHATSGLNVLTKSKHTALGILVQVVVNRLSSLEDLGNITLLCTDKTGTLTEGKMSIQKIVADDPLRLQQFAAATREAVLLIFMQPGFRSQHALQRISSRNDDPFEAGQVV